MGKRLLNIILFNLTVLIAFGLTGCSSVSADKTFEQTIDEKLYNITHPKDLKVMVSSNPYDFIKSGDGQKDYQYIVSQGQKSLDYMLSKFAGSNDNGIVEYIMAIACSEILKEDTNSKNWASGREWYENYIKSKR